MPAKLEFVEFHRSGQGSDWGMNWVWRNAGDEATTTAPTGYVRITDASGSSVYDGPGHAYPGALEPGQQYGDGTVKGDPMAMLPTAAGTYKLEVWADEEYGGASASASFTVDDDGNVSEITPS